MLSMITFFLLEEQSVVSDHGCAVLFQPNACRNEGFLQPAMPWDASHYCWSVLSLHGKENAMLLGSRCNVQSMQSMPSCAALYYVKAAWVPVTVGIRFLKAL